MVTHKDWLLLELTSVPNDLHSISECGERISSVVVRWTVNRWVTDSILAQPGPLKIVFFNLGLGTLKEQRVPISGLKATLNGIKNATLL